MSQEQFTPFSKFVDKSKVIGGWEAQPALPATVMSIATLPSNQSKKNIKAFLKENLFPPNHDIRSVLYKNLVKRIPCNTSMFSEQLFIDFTAEHSLPRDKKLHLPSYLNSSEVSYHYLNEEGKFALHNILISIEHYFPQVSYCPMLSTIAILFLHYDSSASHVFESVCRVLFSNPEYIHYLDLTKPESHSSAMVLKELVIKHTPASHKSLQQFISDPNTIYSEWLKGLFSNLPFKYIVILFDMFLLEGYKALYRMAITLLKFYRKVGVLQNSNILHSVFQFVQTIDNKVSVSMLFKKAFNLKLARSKDLKRFHSRQLSNVNNAPISMENQAELTRNPWTYLSIVRDATSDIGNETLFSTLYCWIPERFTLEKPKCIFSSSTHGYNLNTFFQLSMEIEPSILLIKTVNEEVIGAYCSAPWSKTDEKYFYGTGETFLFSLVPKSEVYYWTGSNMYTKRLKTNDENNKDEPEIIHDSISSSKGIILPPLTQSSSSSNSANITYAESKESSVCLPPIHGKAIQNPRANDKSLDSEVKDQQKTKTTNMFMMADGNTITIGGGNGFGLQIDKSFLHCITEKCDTFNNNPLVQGEHFQCSIVELFSFGV